MGESISFPMAVVAEGIDTVSEMKWIVVVEMAESALSFLELMRWVVCKGIDYNARHQQ